MNLIMTLVHDQQIFKLRRDISISLATPNPGNCCSYYFHLSFKLKKNIMLCIKLSRSFLHPNSLLGIILSFLLPLSLPHQCSAPQPISSYTKFQLMSKQVPNKADYSSPPRTVLDANSPPLILLQLYRFQKLVIQETMVSGLEYDIFFLGTSE